MKNKAAHPKQGLTGSLNHSLAHLLDLKLQAKQTHWNIQGESFIAVHELLDKTASEVDDYADLLAERARQLGAAAHGTLQAVAKISTLPAYPTGVLDIRTYLTALTKSIKTVSDLTRDLIDESDKKGDKVTADICTQVTRGLDKLHWLIVSHII